MAKNTIHINGYIQKRNGSDFTDEQTKELSERIIATIEQLGYVMVEKVDEVTEVDGD